MAINPDVAFPGKTAGVSPQYPYGEARDVSSSGDGTGTPLRAAWVNDWFGLQQQLLSLAGIVPSGVADAVGACQVWEALRKLLVTKDGAPIRVTDFMTDSQKADAKAYTYALDMTPAFTSAVVYAVSVGGGDVIVPRGGYRLDGASGLDGLKNGVLLPDTNGDFSTRGGVTLVGEGVGTVLKAGSTNMVVVRSSRLYSQCRYLRIDGANLAGVQGLSEVPESTTQTTELVSQSFQRSSDLHIENCVYGMVLQPGPTVLGADSGAFYFDFNGITFNNNSANDIWFKAPAGPAGNRVTRTTFSQCKFLRGKDPVRIDVATEIDFVNCNWEMWTGTMFNYAPAAANAANIRIIGGYGESSGAAVGPVAAAPQSVYLIGFAHNRPPHSSEFSMNVVTKGRLNIAKDPNLLAQLAFGNGSFVAFEADPLQNGQKTLDLKINSATKERWGATGDKTFFGSDGNVVTSSTGRLVTFTAAAGAQITNVSQLVYGSNSHFWKTGAGADIFSMSATEFVPRVDNAMSFGVNGLRLSAIWAANGVIQTSDPSTKIGVEDSPLGLDFIMGLRPVSYRFKVGGNDIVGEEETTPAVLSEDGSVIEPAVSRPIVQPREGRRTHYGFLTTDVKAAANLAGVDFGGYVKSDLSDPDSEEGLRYDEFIAPLVRAVQQLTERVRELESK